MKKLIALVLTVVLVMTVSVPAVFAHNSIAPQTSSTQLTGLQSYSLSDLYKMFKQYHKDKSKRTSILKQILEKKKSAANNKSMTMVFVNGNELASDVPPVFKYSRTLIPVRALMTALGAEVTWDQATKTVTVTKEGIKIVLKLDSNIVLVNDKEVKIEVPASSHNGRTVIPLRFIAEQFGQNVDWDSTTGSIIIEDKDQNTTTPVIQNLAFNKTPAVSSFYDDAMTADKAFDGKTDTRWSSQYTDDQWISVDLGQVQSIGKVKLSWETAYAKAYKVLVSADNTNWTEVYNTTAGDGGIDEITFNPLNARYVKVQGIQRATNYGYSLLEFEVYIR